MSAWGRKLLLDPRLVPTGESILMHTCVEFPAQTPATPVPTLCQEPPCSPLGANSYSGAHPLPTAIPEPGVHTCLNPGREPGRLARGASSCLGGKLRVLGTQGTDERWGAAPTSRLITPQRGTRPARDSHRGGLHRPSNVKREIPSQTFGVFYCPSHTLW